MIQRPKIAIAHDYLRTYGGGERVLEVLHQMFPQAPIFVATADFEGLGPHVNRLKKLPLHTSWVQKIPFMAKKPILYRWLLPWVWRSFKTTEFDVIISSSGSNIAKAIPVRKGSIHLCYCHTPPRFLYGLATERHWPQWINWLVSPFLKWLRAFDYQTSQQVTTFIANSQTVADRITKFYGRTAQVIYPPISFKNRPLKKMPKKTHFLVVSRLVKNKHIDLIVAAFNTLQLPLLIIGTGPELSSLQKLAKPNITFLGELPDIKLPHYYQQAQALILASEAEDFGITPIEANAFGTPVIAFFSGGFKETIIPNQTGIFFKKLTAQSLITAVRKFQQMKFKPHVCYAHSQNFSREIFIKNFQNVITESISISSP